MALRRRSLALALVVLACLGASLPADPPPYRTAQRAAPGSSAEPPLVDGAAQAPETPGPGTPCPTDPPTPVVSISVRVLASAAPGEPLEYRLCVKNSSPAAANHVVVRNPVPEHATYVSARPKPDAEGPELQWRLGTLGPGACREIVLVLRPAGTGDVKNCARVQFEHGQCVVTRITRPRLSLRKTGPAQAAVNERLTFRITVTNPGSTEAREVTLSDLLDPGLHYARQPPDDPTKRQELKWDLGTLAPGQSRTVSYEAVPRVMGRLCNRAVVNAAGGLRDEATHCVTVGAPTLSLLLTGPAEALVKRATAYQVSVGNTGNLTATNVTVTVPLPAGVQFDSASEGGESVGGSVRWRLGTLAPGGRRNLRLRLVATAPGEVTVEATATADRGQKASETIATLFSGAGGLTFLTEPEENPVFVGMATSYTIQVVNTGTAAAKDVRIVVRVPDKMEVSDARGPAGLVPRIDKQLITFPPLATLAPRAEVSYQVFVTPKAADNDARLVVEMTAAEPKLERPVRKETPITIANPGQ